jgi:hypothetical protein
MAFAGRGLIVQGECQRHRFIIRSVVDRKLFMGSDRQNECR